MNKFLMPNNFVKLISEGCISGSDIVRTDDGLHVVFSPLSDILAKKNVLDFPSSDGKRLFCNNFFDDWFLYAVPHEADYIYGLLKLREQEYDADGEDPADGDTPGVTISFISFNTEALFDCLSLPTDENRLSLSVEINRVVVSRGQSHHRSVKKYFADPASEGPYLVAYLYARHVASFSRNGCIPVSEHYTEILRQSKLRKNSGKLGRLPRFIDLLNQRAGRVVCDNENIFLRDAEHPDEFECEAILATHTGNTTMYSFAAEVEFHAKFLTPLAKIRLPFYGRSIYDSAIRADMTIDDSEFEGTAPFYKTDSKIVKRQFQLHCDTKTFFDN